MSEAISATYQYLLSKYGPLLTLKHVAEVMHTTPNGVRMAITRRRQSFAAGLAAARRRLGRRVYFEARCVAEVIDRGAPAQAAFEGPEKPDSRSEIGVSVPQALPAPRSGPDTAGALRWGR